MKTLALEMSTAKGSVGFRDGGQVFDVSFAADRKHSGEFFENLQRCLGRWGEPQQIVVGLGPGSYAGVRIAIAAGLGLRAATGAKLFGIPSICALEVEANDCCVVGDARRNAFFFAEIRDRRLLAEPILESAAELETRLKRVTGPVYASENLSRFPAVQLAYPSAGRLAEIVVRRGNEITDAETLEPIYLREPHITTPKQR